MDSKNEYRRNKKINKNKRYDDQRKKNTFLNDNPDDNYNELTYGHFDKKKEEFDKKEKFDEKEEIKENILYPEKKVLKEIIIEEEFTEDYFEPVIYTKKN